MKDQITKTREKLSSKYLLTPDETRRYLGITKRQFSHLLENDPFFPKPKAGTLFSRFLIDDWLRRNNTDMSIDMRSLRWSPHAIQIPISMSQLN